MLIDYNTFNFLPPGFPNHNLNNSYQCTKNKWKTKMMNMPHLSK